MRGNHNILAEIAEFNLVLGYCRQPVSAPQAAAQFTSSPLSRVWLRPRRAKLSSPLHQHDYRGDQSRVRRPWHVSRDAVMMDRKSVTIFSAYTRATVPSKSPSKLLALLS